MDATSIARALNGKVRQGRVYAPGPGHSLKDKSLVVYLDATAPEGFRVHSFAADDWRECLDYVRERLGLPRWENGGAEHIDLSRWRTKTLPKKEKAPQSGPSREVAAYDYTDRGGNLLYQVVRYEPKDFRQRRPKGGGGWEYSLGETPRVLYRLTDLLAHPNATVFFAEGEKDADRVASLGHCATTVASGAWEGSWGRVDISALVGRDVLVLEDNDDEGRKRGLAAAEYIAAVASTVRIIRLPGLPEKGDVSDFLDADPGNAGDLVELCFAAPVWKPPQQVGPVDLWAVLTPPELPRGLLPPVIESFAREQGELMGADPAGLAMAALTVCAAAIPDRVKLQVKVHEHGWKESARIWTALIGPPSTKKSPILRRASAPLLKLDKRLHEAYARQCAEYAKLSKEERESADPPKKERLRIEDITIEAAQEILKDSPDGVLCLNDELTGWFGGMDKYNGGGKGIARDRGFWLSAFNGQPAVVDRIGRGSTFIPNLSISLLGGVQPEPMRALLRESMDDGLIQRLFPIILRSAVLGSDVEYDNSEYSDLIEKLRDQRFRGKEEIIVKFSDQAQQVRRQLEADHLEMAWLETVNPKLGAHIGKFDGLYPRLCLIWHCIENASWGAIEEITADTARRVARFLHEFLLPHAAAFYGQGMDERSPVSEAADFLLTHPDVVEVSARDAARGNAALRKLRPHEIEEVFSKLEILGWVDRVTGPRPSSPGRWRVNEICHRLFQSRAQSQTDRRHRLHEFIKKHPGVVHEQA